MWKRVTSVKKLNVSHNNDGVQTDSVSQSSPCGESPPGAKLPGVQPSGAQPHGAQPIPAYNMSERTAAHLINSIFFGYQLEPEPKKGASISPARIEREQRQLRTWLTQSGPTTGQTGWLGKAQKFTDQHSVPNYYSEDWLDVLAAEAPEPTWIPKFTQNHEKSTGLQTASQNIPLSPVGRWSTPDIDWTVDERPPR